MRVIFPPSLQRRFSARCKSAFPNEEYAILLGKELRNGDFEVHELYYPGEREAFSTPFATETPLEWFHIAESVADSLELSLLGDIHSHCYDFSPTYDPKSEPSETDWRRAEYLKGYTHGKYRIFGVTCVIRNGEKTTARTKFWPVITIPVLSSRK